MPGLTAIFIAPDDQLNPISIRITYEVNQGGPKYLVYGADVRLKLTDKLSVGIAGARDENPATRPPRFGPLLDWTILVVMMPAGYYRIVHGSRRPAKRPPSSPASARRSHVCLQNVPSCASTSPRSSMRWTALCATTAEAPIDTARSGMPRSSSHTRNAHASAPTPATQGSNVVGSAIRSPR